MSFTIKGTGSALPRLVVTNDDLSRIVDTSDEWITTRTGVKERRVLSSETLTDLALEAAEKAMADAGVDPLELDFILCATIRGDVISPSMGCLLQGRLGANCPAMDVNAACSGFMYALDVAGAFFSSGRVKKMLVVAAEALSPVVDWTDRTTCVLFGDGAGAVVLEASDTPGILATDLHADGKHVGILCVPGTVAGGQVLGDPLLKMDGQAVFKLAVGVLDKAARAVLAKADKTEADIDWLLPHQANIRIMQSTAKKLHLPQEKVVVTVHDHGNTSAASIPLALDHGVRAGQVKPGQTVLLEGVGGGFTWGAVLLVL